mmetsp:Transcript_232/g.389  ORF Transcript_232/g.389 Transcript_232/m.389 type:complete len:134 (-) Transcript_232:188-589(-)
MSAYMNLSHKLSKQIVACVTSKEKEAARNKIKKNESSSSVTTNVHSSPKRMMRIDRHDRRMMSRSTTVPPKRFRRSGSFFDDTGRAHCTATAHTRRLGGLIQHHTLLEDTNSRTTNQPRTRLVQGRSRARRSG